MLGRCLASGQLTILYRYAPVEATLTAGNLVESVTLGCGAEGLELYAAYFLDATDLGDLLPLCGAPFVTGAEAQTDTGEPHAPTVANPNELQAMTYGFAAKHRPGESHIISKPKGYERFRGAGLYSLTLDNGDGKTGRRFQMFGSGDHGALPFWSYRRLLEADLLGVPNDLALIHWASNDYFWRGPFDLNAHAKAKAQALGFLYWLQTEVPRDDGGFGYPELKLRPNGYPGRSQ